MIVVVLSHLSFRTDELMETCKTEYYHDIPNKALKTNDIWKELRNMGLLPKQEEDLNGFSKEELNSYFASVSVFSCEDNTERLAIINLANEEGFKFQLTGTWSGWYTAKFDCKSFAHNWFLSGQLFNDSLASGVFPAF